jgi:hypothetical protein
MCISLVLYDSHPALLLLLAFNRDEFWDRQVQLAEAILAPYLPLASLLTAVLACCYHIAMWQVRQASLHLGVLPAAACLR